MTIKVALLNTGDQVISDVKEIVSEERPVGYLFNKPQKVTINKPFLVSEEDDDRSYEVTFTKWILLTSDDDIAVPMHNVISLVEPLDSIRQMYLERINGTDNQVSSTED